MLKSLYRREPISSFILLASAVNVVIGGVNQEWLLMSLGLGAVGLSVATRWLFLQNMTSDPEEPSAPQKYLPPASSRQALPELGRSNSINQGRL